MGNICACIRPSKEALCSPLAGSSEAKLLAAAPAASTSERVATCSPPLPRAGTERTVERAESEKRSIVEERIESSKAHWSLLSKPHPRLDDEDGADVEMIKEEEELIKASNVQVFKTLQSHPTWGNFFSTFGYDLQVPGRGSAGLLEVGEKFAEGGQAELFHARITWVDPKYNELYRKEGIEWVLKVFKKGTLLDHLQSQWPKGMLQWHAEEHERTKLGNQTGNRHHCQVGFSTLLKDGQFAFLMIREQEDLRSVIDRNMLTNVGKSHGPFQKESEEAEMIMYRIALGMDWLHSRNIVHRDLKASNVLMRKGPHGDWWSFVADYECSIGVVGTGFWRAPEILQACKEKNISERPELFTKQVDAYSYGMTCYEILTGKLPFKGHPCRDYDLVLNGKRPEVPKYVDDWACELLKRCWQSNPLDRPSFGDILNLLEANSARVRAVKLQWDREAFQEEQL